MQNKQPRPPPEAVAKLYKLHNVWAREDKEINEVVFKDLDIMLRKFKEKAYNDEHYEAFAHLEKLHEYIHTGFAAKLKSEIDFINQIPE